MIVHEKTEQKRAKARIGDRLDLDGPIMDGAHYPRYVPSRPNEFWCLTTLGLARTDFII